jgi:hypothetical protein
VKQNKPKNAAATSRRVTKFQSVGAILEKILRRFPYPYPDTALGSKGMLISSVLAKCYGMALHQKVNDALAKAISGGIYKTKEFGTICEAFFLSYLLHRKDPRLSAIQESLTESVVTAVCKGEVSEKARLAFLNPPGGFVQNEVIEAYRRAIRDDGSAPTLAEVRTQFEEENKPTLLPKGFSLRKMVTKTFGLPLTKDKRGPKIRNPSR